MAELPPTVAPTWRPRTDAWLNREPSPYAGAANRPLFIGACPRSGTTLLRVMLDSHPDLALPHETNFIRQLYWQRRSFGDLKDPANRRRAAEFAFYTKGTRDKRLLGEMFTREEAVERVVAGGPTMGSIIGTCLQLYAEATGKARWGDKRPAYSGFMAELFRMFPDALYINLVRDPRGAVTSQLGMPWDKPDVAFPAAIARWEASVDRTDRFAAKLRPDQFLDVRYEDMVANPHVELERICAFAGLSAGEAIATMVSADDRAQLKGPFSNTAKPVTTASVEKWRERLEPGQVKLVERTLDAQIARFGYEPADDIQAEPPPAEAAELARQRKRFQRAWRNLQAAERWRRLVYRQPVVAKRPI